MSNHLSVSLSLSFTLLAAVSKQFLSVKESIRVIAFINTLYSFKCSWFNCQTDRVVGFADVGWCWQLCANGLNKQCKDVQCIMGKIRPIRLCKLTKFGCHLVFNMHSRQKSSGVEIGLDISNETRIYVMRVRGPNNVGIPVVTDPTLPYASAITEQKKCWELAQKFEQLPFTE